MVIRRFFTTLGACALLAACAGCYDDNCFVRNVCPGLGIDGVELEPEPQPDDPKLVGPVPLPGTAVQPVATGEPATILPLPGPFCPRDLMSVLDGCGIFVSASKGDDAAPGTRKKPVRTLKHALDLAIEEKRGIVYACAEVFEETVLLPPGARVIGGLDCDDDWESIGFFEKTEIVAKPGEHALVAIPGEARSKMVDVRMRAVDAVVPGGSSVAAVAWDDTKVDFFYCEFYAGKGADGLDGMPGSLDEPVAPGGAPGLHGASACSADAPPGGGMVYVTCDDGVTTAGGIGGKGGATAGWNATPGIPEPDPNPDAMGAYGLGETSQSSCLPGAKGSAGTDGQHGSGAVSIGAYGENGYVGANGGDGGNGTPGQGGGGGGGARAGAQFCGNKPHGGAGGGSGGSGGCGGRGGMGGTFGGASIGLVIGLAEVSVTAGTIVTGNGGDGGTGGMFQVGGDGGPEGHGGFGYAGSLKGCSGGPGGRGGNGGYGGGGQGGPSIGVVHKMPEPDVQLSVYELGNPGKGGLGGNPNVESLNGVGGVVAEMVILPNTL